MTAVRVGPIRMGIIAFFHRLPNRDLERLLAEPELVRRYLRFGYGEEEEEGFGPFVTMDVDKAWHGIHFLLTGSAEGDDRPECFIVAGGRWVGNDDDVGLGYGRARGFTNPEVKQIAEMLAAADEATLRSRYDPHVMTRDEVYPSDIWECWPPEDDPLGFLIDQYTVLRKFIIEAAQADEALVAYFG